MELDDNFNDSWNACLEFGEVFRNNPDYFLEIYDEPMRDFSIVNYDLKRVGSLEAENNLLKSEKFKKSSLIKKLEKELNLNVSEKDFYKNSVDFLEKERDDLLNKRLGFFEKYFVKKRDYVAVVDISEIDIFLDKLNFVGGNVVRLSPYLTRREEKDFLVGAEWGENENKSITNSYTEEKCLVHYKSKSKL